MHWMFPENLVSGKFGAAWREVQEIFINSSFDSWKVVERLHRLLKFEDDATFEYCPKAVSKTGSC